MTLSLIDCGVEKEMIIHLFKLTMIMVLQLDTMFMFLMAFVTKDHNYLVIVSSAGSMFLAVLSFSEASTLPPGSVFPLISSFVYVSR